MHSGRFSFPPRYFYDVLRGLDYMRSADVEPDERCAEGIDLVEKKRAVEQPSAPCGSWTCTSAALSDDPSHITHDRAGPGTAYRNASADRRAHQGSDCSRAACVPERDGIVRERCACPSPFMC